MVGSVSMIESQPSVMDATLPSLKVLRNMPAETDAPVVAAEAGPWRSAAIGAVLGFFAAAMVITVASTLAGIGAGGALGLGVFVGGFGGAGFGFMMGGMYSLGRALSAPVPSSAPDTGRFSDSNRHT